MSIETKAKHTGLFVLLCIGVFILFTLIGVVSKIAYDPSHGKYSVKWDDSMGTIFTDIPYGNGESNKFDLYLPADNTKENYGLAVYLHAGGFTTGDKSDDTAMLQWLCSKGYVACGINYTLRTDTNGSSVLQQSNEIRSAIPVVVSESDARGYHIDKMTMAGGSAGHALAMIYAYRDGADAPVPVVFTFGGVGPSCFYKNDWDNYGFDSETEEAYQDCAGLFSAMLGEELTAEEIKDGSYVEKMKPISAAAWITPDSPPTVVAYGTHDKVQPFKASLRLKEALEKNGVDHVYLELPHSGHGLQNDSRISNEYMEAIEKYLEKYMPVQ